MGRRYPDLEAGQWVQPKRRGYRLACCGCGLVHRVNFRIVRGIAGRRFIQMQFFLDNRATANVRRGIKRRRKQKR